MSLLSYVPVNTNIREDRITTVMRMELKLVSLPVALA